MYDKDNGYKSRKMVMAYVAMGLITSGFLLTGKVPGLQPIFAEFCAAIIGCTSVYVGGNAFVKYFGAKNKPKKKEVEEDE